MACSKSVANALGLNKQDNTNGTCATDVEQIIIWLAKNIANKITEIITCSNHGTMIPTGITSKKIPCYMRDSACGWFIVEKSKVF